MSESGELDDSVDSHNSFTVLGRKKVLSDIESSAEVESSDIGSHLHTSQDLSSMPMTSIVPVGYDDTFDEDYTSFSAVPAISPSLLVDRALDVALTSLVKIEQEEAYLDSLTEYPEEGTSKVQRACRRKSDPGASLSTAETLNGLRSKFGISDEVELIVPSGSERVYNPPPGHFSLYEAFFEDTFLWFPIPELFVRFLDRLGLCFSQLTPGSIRHLVGILVRSYECDLELDVDHLFSLLNVVSSRSSKLTYFLTSKTGMRLIGDFPNKDHHWKDHFFFVPISDASIEGGCEHLVRTNWEPRGS